MEGKEEVEFKLRRKGLFRGTRTYDYVYNGKKFRDFFKLRDYIISKETQKFQDALKKLEEVGEVVNICVSSNEEYKAMQIKLKDWNKLKKEIKEKT